jgi:hypothetical protein
MPRIIIEASPTQESAGERTFSERIVTQNLQSGHYTAQLLERMIWAVADAEAAEAMSPDDLGIASPRGRRSGSAMHSLYFG